jgi:hypothetical protein
MHLELGNEVGCRSLEARLGYTICSAGKNRVTSPPKPAALSCSRRLSLERRRPQPSSSTTSSMRARLWRQMRMWPSTRTQAVAVDADAVLHRARCKWGYGGENNTTSPTSGVGVPVAWASGDDAPNRRPRHRPSREPRALPVSPVQCSDSKRYLRRRLLEAAADGPDKEKVILLKLYNKPNNILDSRT